MISKLKSSLALNLSNMKGWRTNRKIVVFESDDWGSIRMPSRSVFKALQRKGIPVEKSPYCRYDTLEDNQDLEHLFNILLDFKDINGNHPIITANTVVANPKFSIIKESGYRVYAYEPFTETLKGYPNHDKVFEYYQQGIDNKIFYPQFHGREHVNVNLWLRLLKENKNFELAFQNNMWGLSNDVFPNRKSIQATFDCFDNERLSDSVNTGLELFENIFGYTSKSFIANNFIWSKALEKVLASNGIKYIQGMRYQKLPTIDGTSYKLIRHYLGEKNELNQIYGIRNSSFEPSVDGRGYRKTLSEIQNAFLWNKPAIISVHRINFIGGLSESNRSVNGFEFRKLLNEVIKKWPNVEFFNTVQLNSIIRNE